MCESACRDESKTFPISSVKEWKWHKERYFSDPNEGLGLRFCHLSFRTEVRIEKNIFVS
jgi:hypothetical protein